MTTSAITSAALSSDGTLATEAANGNREAFRQLHARHDARMRGIARSILGSDTDAEDAVQEAWMRIYARLSRVRGDARPWINVIVRNEARRIGARRGRGDLPVELVPETRDLRNEPDVRAELGERLRAITKTVSEMSDGDRATLALCADGASPSDIADALGVSSINARVMAHRARRRVADRLEELGLAA